MTIFILALLVFPRLLVLLLPSDAASDRWTHIIFAREFGGRLLGSVGAPYSQFYPVAKATYPPAIQHLTAALGLTKATAVIKIFHGILLLAEALLVYQLCGEFRGESDLNRVLLAAIVGFAPYYATPISGSAALSARLSGLAVCNLYFAAAFVLPPGLALTLTMAFLLLVAVYVSKFAVQAALIISILHAIIFTSLQFLYPVLLGLALILLIPTLRTIFVGSIRHNDFYARLLQFRHIATAKKNKSLSEALNAITAKKDFSTLARTVYHTPLIRAVLYFPALWLLLFSAIQVGISSEETLLPFEVLLCGLVCLLAFSWGPLRFLGEADRYIFFSFSTIGFVLVAATSHSSVALASCATISIASWLILMRESLHRRSRNEGFELPESEEAQLKAAIERGMASIDGTGQMPMIMMIPQNLCEKPAAICPGYEYIGLSGNQIASRESRHYLETLYHDTFYPFPSDIERFATDLGRDILVVIEQRYIEGAYLRRNAHVESVRHYYLSLDLKNTDSQFVTALVRRLQAKEVGVA